MLESWVGHTLTIITMAGGAFGWYTTVRLNRAASRSQHTFDVLLTTALDEAYQQQLSAVRPYFVKAGNDGFPNLNNARRTQLRNSVLFLLNYYEFLAGAVRYGVLSEKLLRDDQGFIIRQLFKHTKSYIDELRAERRRPALFEQLEWLYDRWSGEGVPRFQRLLEWALTRPMYGRRRVTDSKR